MGPEERLFLAACTKTRNFAPAHPARIRSFPRVFGCRPPLHGGAARDGAVLVSGCLIQKPGTAEAVPGKSCEIYLTTLIFSLAFLPLAVLTVMVAVPLFLAVITPELFTDATFLLEEL